jgi:hypothetical protein
MSNIAPSNFVIVAEHVDFVSMIDIALISCPVLFYFEISHLFLSYLFSFIKRSDFSSQMIISRWYLEEQLNISLCPTNVFRISADSFFLRNDHHLSVCFFFRRKHFVTAHLEIVSLTSKLFANYSEKSDRKYHYRLFLIVLREFRPNFSKNIVQLPTLRAQGSSWNNIMSDTMAPLNMCVFSYDSVCTLNQLKKHLLELTDKVYNANTPRSDLKFDMTDPLSELRKYILTK